MYNGFSTFLNCDDYDDDDYDEYDDDYDYYDDDVDDDDEYDGRGVSWCSLHRSAGDFSPVLHSAMHTNLATPFNKGSS